MNSQEITPAHMQNFFYAFTSQLIQDTRAMTPGFYYKSSHGKKTEEDINIPVNPRRPRYLFRTTNE